MAKKALYVITAPASWEEFAIRYRRHYLAEHLLRQDDTAAVIWIYAVKATPRITGSYRKAKQEIEERFFSPVYDGRIIECPLPDFVPGRAMRFKSGFGHLYFKKLKAMLKSYDAPKVLWFTYPLYPYLAKMVSWDVIAYDCSDLWSAPIDGFRPRDFSSLFYDRLIRAAEKAIIDASGIIFASSDFLAEKIKENTGREALIIENGVDLGAIMNGPVQPAKIFEKIPRPRLGYVGSLKKKLDIELLETMAGDNPGWSLVLVGPSFLEGYAPFSRLLARKNVYFSGAVAKPSIAAYISGLQVGLLPYRDIEYNRASFPLKFYEYLAQGIPVVGCGLPSTSKLAQDQVYLHVDRDDFQQACEKALAWTAAESEQDVDRRMELARKANWEDKLSSMVEQVKRLMQ